MRLVPLKPDDAHSSDALLNFLEGCRQVAGSVGRPQLVSITLESERLDPLAVLESIYDPGELHFYAERPSASIALAGAEAVASTVCTGPDRFARAGAWVRDLLDHAIAIGPANLPFGGPLFFGTFAFGDLAPTGAPFPAARVFVPRWQVARTADRSIAVANAMVSADTDVRLTCERIWRAHAKFASFDYTATGLDRGGDGGGVASEHEVGGDGRFVANVRCGVEAIRAGRYRKVVLARATDLHAQTGFHPLRALNGLRQRYPDCYAFSIGNGAGSSFIGASPERLISVSGGRLATEALAGSAPRGRTAGEDARLARDLLHSEKDVREQGLVLESIVRRLESVGVSRPEVGKLRVRQLSNVQHLCSPVEANLPDGVDAFRLVGELHPTPAVGGTPREAAIEHLRELEPFDRGLYAGALGWTGHSGDAEFFVGIRSALMSGSTARVYAGAGIVEGSEPERELAETEIKMRPLREALADALG